MNILEYLRQASVMEELTSMVRRKRNEAVSTVFNYTEPLIEHFLKVLLYRNSTGTQDFWTKELYSMVIQISKVRNGTGGKPFKYGIYYEGMSETLSDFNDIDVLLQHTIDVMGKSPIVSRAKIKKEWPYIKDVFLEL